MKKKPNLVAHRGYAALYPENSMSAFQAAVDCGCLYLELDIQLSQDLVPVIIHDISMMRTGDVSIDVVSHRFEYLSQFNIGERTRFGEQFATEKLTSLSDFSLWLSHYPNVKVFVEVKEESIHYFGNKTVFQKTMEAINGIHDQVFLISFDAGFLFYAKQYGDLPVGYILHRYDSESYSTAIKLQPEILICNYQKIPDEDNALWQDSWDWFLYEITDPALAMRWANRGVSYIETMEIKPMLEVMLSEV